MSHMVEHDLDPEELEQLEQEEDVFDTSSQGSSTQTSTLTWINWYCSLPGHDYFCEVHEDFIEDDFNLTGLQGMVPFWKEALEMVLDVEPEEDSAKIPDVSIVESSAELLYGLCHQRFILTKAGLGCMVDKYEAGHFGSCPRVFCLSTHVLPCGRTDMPGIDTVKLFCPNCGDIYSPPSSKYQSVDGAFFGTTFAPLFFQTYPELLAQPFFPAPPGTPSSSSLLGTSTSSPSPNLATPGTPGGAPVGGETITNPNPHGGQKPALGKVYVPKIYGFKVSERARSGPRMKWLRERPERADELDNVDWKSRWKDGKGASGQLDDVDAEMGMGARVKKTKGRLFDDEDDEVDEEDDEEEEEDAAAATGTGTGTAQAPPGKTKPPVPPKADGRKR